MKKVRNGKVYDSDKMEIVAKVNAYHNGNYSGMTKLGRTPGGLYAIITTSNGQDCYRSNDMVPLDEGEAAGAIEGWELSDTEAARLAELGIVAVE